MMLGVSVLILTAAGIYVYAVQLKTRKSTPDGGRDAGCLDSHCSRIIKCRVSHHRLFPKQHGFTYPYLSVVVPVRSPTSNRLLSVGNTPWWKQGWLHVAPEDHLNRGRDGVTLSENIDAYLRLQGLDPTEFPHVHLLTSPRFLNYVFKPASFWYICAADKTLKYVVAEVNNTFDERRMYLFPAGSGDGIFKQTLNKDFHVSPFSSRRGSYALATKNLAEQDDVSVIVTLRSSKGHAKLVARWWSMSPAMNPSDMSTLESSWLLFSWGWTILTTYIKIVFQAILLAQVHRLHIWYRPEPKESAIPRRSSSTETFIAVVFLQYLQHLLNVAPNKCRLITQPTRGKEEQKFQGYGFLAMKILQNGDTEVADLRVQSAQFFRQLITHKSLSDYLSHTLLDSYEENRTAWSNDTQSLIKMIRDLEKAAQKQRRDESRYGEDDTCNVPWAVYTRLRCNQPHTSSYPYPGLPHVRNKAEVRHDKKPQARTVGLCFLDEFVRDHCNPLFQAKYMAAALGLQWRTRVMEVIGGE